MALTAAARLPDLSGFQKLLSPAVPLCSIQTLQQGKSEYQGVKWLAPEKSTGDSAYILPRD